MSCIIIQVSGVIYDLYGRSVCKDILVRVAIMKMNLSERVIYGRVKHRCHYCEVKHEIRRHKL